MGHGEHKYLSTRRLIKPSYDRKRRRCFGDSSCMGWAREWSAGRSLPAGDRAAGGCCSLVGDFVGVGGDLGQPQPREQRLQRDETTGS
jgi:hypothetical protein